MKIKSTQIESTVKDVDLDLKGTYKEPYLTFTLDGTEIFKVAIDASTIPSVSGANDTLVFAVSVSGVDGIPQTLTKQVHVPTFKAETAPIEEEPATTEAEPEAAPIEEVKPV